MSDHQSDETLRRRRRLLITLGASLAGAYVAPTLVNVARAHPGPHRHGSRGSYSRPSYSRPSGKHHHHHHDTEYRYYRDDRRRGRHHHDAPELHLRIPLSPSRW